MQGEEREGPEVDSLKVIPVNVDEFRDGIFNLRTRRFGKVAEILIKKLLKVTEGTNQFHDLYDPTSDDRIEVKFSTVLKANESVITENNVIEQILDANVKRRAIKSTEWEKHEFDCNIQQIKRAEFDVLYYGLFFEDRIVIFSQTSLEVGQCLGYSNKQHKGNVGEGQFHLNRATFGYHIKNHLKRWLTYDELLQILLPDCKQAKK